MQVVLLKDHAQLGQKGIVRTVKDGYYRNFLEPNMIARKAKIADVERFEKQEEERLAKRREMMVQAAKMAEKLENGTVTLEGKVSQSGSLYAQIHELEVAQAVNASFGTAIEKGDVKFEKAVKKVGDYKFEVKLGADTIVEMTLVVKGDVE